MTISFERRLAEELSAVAGRTIEFTSTNDGCVWCSIDGGIAYAGSDPEDALDTALEEEENR